MNGAITKIKGLYRQMSLREKLLALAFILVIHFLWTNNWLGRLSEWNDQRKFAATELEFQRQTLERGPEFSEGLKRALERVDPSKTFAADKLSEQIDKKVRSAGLSAQAEINSVDTDEGEIFNDHNLRVTLKRITIDQLIKFNALLKEDTPYINIQEVRIKAAPRNPEQLDVRFKINSFDLKDIDF